MSQTEKTVPLTLAEATDLAAGLVASSAAESGIDALVVKGRYAAEQGLRPVRTASDVDVLVRVDDCPRIIKVLERKGWSPRPVDPDDAIFPHHSIPLIHPGWPCDIDVHTNFPGCDAHPDAVFDALFARRVPAEAAASPIWIPDATATALIMALHSLRTPRGDPELSDLQFVERAAPALVNGADLVALAEKAGALGALLPFLASVFPQDIPPSVSPPSREWILRWTAPDSATVRLISLRQANWRDRPGLVLRAIRPSREALAAINLEALSADDAELRRLRLRRFGGALRRLPAIVGEYRAYQREVARQRAVRGG